METYKVIIDGHKTIRWYKYDTSKLHKINGPAIEYIDGEKYWYDDDKLHRMDGPAVEYVNGKKYWYINGENLTEEQFNQKTSPTNCHNKIVEIDGKKYKLTLVE